MKIRDMRAQDLVALREVYLHTRLQTFYWLEGKTLSPRDFDRDTEGERVWVAEQAGEIIGFIAAWLPENFIHHLFVRPEHARKGHGSRLLEACLGTLGRPAGLKCLAANKDALTFYRAHGWRAATKGVSEDGEYHFLTFD